MNVQLVAAGIYQATGTLVAMAFERRGNPLVRRPGQNEDGKQRGDESDRSPQAL
jgi:hypothetical protein